MRRAAFLTIGFLLSTLLLAEPARSDELKDLHFGESLYYAHQSDFFAALERLDSEVKQHDELDEPELGALFHHINDAEFSLGDFELRYRMHHRAGRAIQAVLEGAVDETVTRVREVMEGAAMPAVKLAVPLTVDAGQGANWAEAH